MLNKSMMRTHASGCHKRRALPAHSLAAAGLSLLLAFSCPLNVRADANFSTDNAFNNIYLQNKNLISDKENIFYYLDDINKRNNLYNYILLENNNITHIDNGVYIKDKTLIIDKNNNYDISHGNDNYSESSQLNYIIKSGSLNVSKPLQNIKSLIMYGNTQIKDTGYGENLNIKFNNNDKIIIDITNNKLHPDGTSVHYNGYLHAENSNFIFIINNNYKNNENAGTILEVSGGCNISNSSFDISINGDIDISKGYILSVMKILGSERIIENITTNNSRIKIGSTIIQGDGVNQSLIVEPLPEINTTGIYIRLEPSENGTIDGAKGISEGYLSGLMLTLQGADLVATRGMQAAMAATKEVEDVTFTPWATVSGSSVRYNTGAHADLNSFNMLTGIALGKGFDAGRVTVGAFFEYGTGSYKTSNSFDGHGSYDGKGDSYYLGWGLLARMDFADTGPGHFYVEGSGRMGGLYNNYSNEDLRDGFGREAEYDSYAPYYSFHAGLGYIWDINEQASLEFYGKYLWTRECGDSVTLSTGEEVDFEDIDSSRLRFGTRLDYRVNEYITPYIGVAWEHEFDGESSATTNNLPILEPDLRGDTGIGEIGLTITPSETIPLTVDLGVTGYVGTREGISGSLLVKWTF
ncbi:hypothetical protein B5F76_05135 [Desulfovibrio sp. An276]|nr:hypothetical protein B5F76_05135 [Desulfovibrio sp. An276]